MSVPLRTNRMLLAGAVDVTLTLLALYLASGLRLVLPFGKELSEPLTQVNALVYLLTGFVWAGVFAQFNLYTRRWTHLRDEWWMLLFAILTALLILSGSLYFTFRQVSRLQFIYFGLIDLVLLSLVRIGYSWWRLLQGERDSWRVLVADSGLVGRSTAEKLAAQHSVGVHVVGFLDDDPAKQGQIIDGLRVLGTLDDAATVIRQEHISEIVLALPHDAHERMLSVVLELELLPVQVSLVPDVLDLAWFMTRVDDLSGVPLLRLRESPLNGPVRAIKRLMDILIASALLVVTFPFMILVALLIKLNSPGPAIIRQKRIGENAQPFGMFKFRTMFSGAETQIPILTGAKETKDLGDEGLDKRNRPQVVWTKRPDDPRITRVGRVLRHYSIDELPQLINVLRGEMSLVGPRPELPWLVDCYESWQRRRFAVPPGMTGWWQISGRSDRPMPLNVEDDLYYIRNYSLWLDVLILLRTIPVVLTGKGAY